jgi:hypothetical protein
MCPECGAAVEISRSGDFLRYADRVWLTRISRGLWWTEVSSLALLLAILVPILLLIVGITVRLVAGDLNLIAGWIIAAPVFAFGIIVLVSPFGIGYGLLLMFTPEPRHLGAPLARRIPGRLPQALSLPAFALCIGIGALAVIPMGQSPLLEMGLATLAAGLLCIHTILLLRYMPHLERRCAGTTAKRLMVIERYRKTAPAFMMLLACMGWLAWLTSLPRGTPLFLDAEAILGWAFLLWLLVLWQLRFTRRSVQRERRASLEIDPPRDAR